ncbi:MAG: NADH-quinone oxidoreductase subunit D [Propionibacteriaceae bacterium]|nr:NADH-quinone oxidoreductase subunit D [Propionibacteriaceae bacterium]
MTGNETVYRIGGIPDPGFSGTWIDVGPTHPTSAGLLDVHVIESDGRIRNIDPRPGALHRGVEMILTARDYRQALSLANRHDWQAPFFGEWTLARLVEDALGIEVPARARWIRAVLAEHSRVASHLAYLSFIGHALGRPDLATDGVREQLRTRLAELTGNRLHPMATRLGGVAADITPAWAAAERETLAAASALAQEVGSALDGGLGAGVAPVSAAHVDAFGLAGPVARASGVDTDLRRGEGPHEEPWAAHHDLLDVDAPRTGDAHARFVHLAAEVTASAGLVDRLLDALPEGPLQAHLPKIVKLPEGDWLARVEAPLGRAGMVVTSRGEKTPWRLRLRTPSFALVSSWAAVLPGTALDDLATAVASLPWVAGDLDK